MQSRTTAIVDHLLEDLAEDARRIWLGSASTWGDVDEARVHDAVHSRLGAVTRILRRDRAGLPVHAALCTLPDGRGVSVLGPTGAGKSTLATSLGTELGATLVSDDTIWLEADGAESVGAPVAIRPNSPFRKAASELWYADESDRLLVRGVDLGIEGVRRSGPIDMLVMPHFDPSRTALEPVSPGNAFCHLAGSLLRSASRAEIDHLADLAGSLPAAAIHYGDVGESIDLCRRFFELPVAPGCVPVHLSEDDRLRSGLCRDVEGLRFGHEAALWRPPSGQLLLVRHWTGGPLRETPAGDALKAVGLLEARKR